MKLLGPVIVVIFLLIEEGICQFSLSELIDNLNKEDAKTSTTTLSPPPNSPIDFPLDERFDNMQHLISSDSRYDPHTSNEISDSILKLSQNIASKILSERRNEKSLVLSPLSIANALYLVLLGSKGNTFDEIMHIMGLDQDRVLTSSVYRIHEEFGLLLEDLLATKPNPTRPRATLNWKVKPYNPYASSNTESRFNFPGEGGNEQITFNSRASLQQQNNNDFAENKIFLANGIFVQKGYSIRPDYKTTVENIYLSEVKNLDFKESYLASSFINNWVKTKTNGKIKDIISGRLPSETKIVIANALYFKALWEKTFIDGATSKKPFYPDGINQREILVDMMAHGGIFPYYDSFEYDCSILGIPYKHNQTTMYIILPNNSTGKKLTELQNTLTTDKINEMITKMELKTSIILFPKMHLTYSTDLTRILYKLGVRSLFDQSTSDLSLISSGLEFNSNTNSFTNPPYQYPTTNNMGNNESPLLFSRFGEDDNITAPIVKEENSTSTSRKTRQTTDPSNSLQNLDLLRKSNNEPNPQLYANQILHKIDLTINEKGTEGGAATTIILTKTGTNVVFRVETPFIFLIRHDETKIPLFYGTVFEPENN